MRDKQHNAGRRKVLYGGAVCLSAALFSFPVIAGDEASIRTDSGLIKGRRKNGAVSFLGVPYAASTSANNRFKAPQPVTPWNGTRIASSFGEISPQISGSIGPLFAEWYDQTAPQGEDCCSLNIFTSDSVIREKRPVMFYIHGGGYINGGSSSKALDGSNLAKSGNVVVVTINHRLNAFGYADLTQIDPVLYGDSANAGHLDIIAALKWVQRNIREFGGDPDNVTLFGQSGGGSKIMVLLGMPSARGLFHKAISMSGAAGLKIDSLRDVSAYTDALVRELNVRPGNTRNLATLSMEDILAARQKAVVASGMDGARPVLDGRHILYQPMSDEGLKIQAEIPLLLGHTHDEASLFFRQDMRNFHLTEDQLQKRLQSAFNISPEKARSVTDAYRTTTPDMTPAQVLIAVASDVQFRLPLKKAAERKSDVSGQAPVFLYEFAWQIPWNGGILGSPHAVDIPFVFGTIDTASEMTGASSSASEASMNIMSAFVQFARTGNPHSERFPEWTPFTRDSGTTMQISENCVQKQGIYSVIDREIDDLKIDPFDRASIYKYED